MMVHIAIKDRGGHFFAKPETVGATPGELIMLDRGIPLDEQRRQAVLRNIENAATHLYDMACAGRG